ncbi:MAG: metal ABC transporter substrate-binding protein [Promethearchaeota archaeon]
MRKTSFFTFTAIALLALSTVGLLPTASTQGAPSLSVAVSIQPLAGIVREVGGTQISISVLLPEGIEPHAFSLTQAIIDEANAADMLVLTGHFDWEEELANQTSKPYISLKDYEALGAELLPLRGYTQNRFQKQIHSENLHGYWLLPKNAIAIANATRILCSALNSTHASYWQERFDEFVIQVEELEAFIAAQSLALGFAGKQVIITFPAEAYVAEALGLEVKGLLMVGDNIFISGPELIAVEQALRNGSINLILASDIAQLQAAGEFAQQLSSDSGVPIVWVRIVFSDLLNYIGIMSYNIGVVATGLTGGLPPGLNFFAISMPVIIIATVIGVIATIELLLLIRCTRTRD